MKCHHDLSILSSGTSVHPDDRCLTTFGSMAHVFCEILSYVARGTRLRGTNITSGQSTPGDWSVQKPTVSSCNSFSEEAKSLPCVTYVALRDKT